MNTQSKSSPRISVFSTCKNGARYLRETIESIQAQTFKDVEHVITDAVSTDGTLRILEEHKHIRWISEPDSGWFEGWHKAISMTRGDYVMCCPISDGYLSRTWMQKCVDVLDNDPEVSLVWGLPQHMSEEGELLDVSFSEFFFQPPPQKRDFLAFWLATFMFYPEITYCVRASVFKQLFPRLDTTDSFARNNPWLYFVSRFNTEGYLPLFLPIVASFGRHHADSLNRTLLALNDATRCQYLETARFYRRSILAGKREHVFRDGEGRAISTLSGDALRRFRRQVLKYRVSRRIYFQAVDPLNLPAWKKKLGMVFDRVFGG